MLAQWLIFEQAQLSDPRYTQWDWSYFSPRLIMWESEMRSLLSTHNIQTPAAWWSNASPARLPSFSHKARSSPALFVREERVRADALSAALINKCCASGTLTAYRNAFL